MQSPVALIRVLVIHGDPLVQLGLTTALGACAEFEVTADACLLDADTPPVDVIVADFLQGISMARTRTGPAHDRPWPSVLIVTGVDRECEIRVALDQGVQGYLLPGCPLDDIVTGVRAVHQQERHLSVQAQTRLARAERPTLSVRETQVVQLISEGLPNKLIGRRLSIEVGTVKAHLTAAFRKLGAQSRTQAMLAAERHGFLARFPASPLTRNAALAEPTNVQ
jgi:DNA-binding NarL/FixJ family response regulator